MIVAGRVQGVWYRQSCAEVAHGAGVHGWVCNRPDGTVEAVLEGEEQAVDEVIVWMRQGPPRAVVQRVEVVDEPPQGEWAFQVR